MLDKFLHTVGKLTGVNWQKIHNWGENQGIHSWSSGNYGIILQHRLSNINLIKMCYVFIYRLLQKINRSLFLKYIFSEALGSSCSADLEQNKLAVYQWWELEEALTALPGGPAGPRAPGGPIRVRLLMGQPWVHLARIEAAYWANWAVTTPLQSCRICSSVRPGPFRTKNPIRLYSDAERQQHGLKSSFMKTDGLPPHI